jgi:DNA-binding NarL/FixJ family response regulator
MSQGDEKKIAEALERIAKILVGTLLKDIQDSDQIQKIARLKECGFQNAEIARMLGTTNNTVNVAVHSLKSKKRPRGKGKKGSKGRKRGRR